MSEMFERKLKRIMYVEDDPAVQQVVSFCLIDIGGYELQICSSGKEALEEAKEFNPELFLLDIRLPEMSGPEILEKLRETDRFKNIPVIFISAGDIGHETIKYSELGVLGIIKKPFDPISICDTINALYQNNEICL